jgi:hypothetical protein
MILHRFLVASTIACEFEEDRIRIFVVGEVREGEPGVELMA